jgi:superfamily II DNA or RNA helicase/HKD family nuclease/diadenosine tetraphosphate (Ap4A) HIT family hydrolase
MNDRCPFCHPDPGRVFDERDLVYSLWDLFPVSQGHALLVTRRHCPTWFEATTEEREALLAGTESARNEIERRAQEGQWPRPDGYNIGINVSDAGGQTIPHLHVHLIPRYRDDVADPRGGVRHVIPEKGNYLREAESVGGDLPRGNRTALTTGPPAALLPRLRADLDRAVAADLAVAFVLGSGIDLIIEHLRDLLDRGGHLRLLTGDYLGVTDPMALQRLLDLKAGFKGDAVIDLRVFQSNQSATSFHPKAYILHFADGSTIAYIGSSNLSRAALLDGVEWNYRLLAQSDRSGIAEFKDAFDELFRDVRTRELTDEWLHAYRARREARATAGVEAELDESILPPQPHEVQREALEALRQTRADGNRAGLVVLATGLGKTLLSAFDSQCPGFERVLFVAHREEILTQAMYTFRRLRPAARIGRYGGGHHDRDFDVLMASIQTIGRVGHLRQFARDHFDYIVIDEFHHASARTYRNLLDHFNPNFLLGLTATPDRSDGADLLALCGENLVYRCDLFEGIRRGLLSSFHYFGVADEVEYSNIPWRSGHFDVERLEQAIATEARAKNAFDQFTKRAGRRTLAFCCSQRHAEFMKGFFLNRGKRVVAVHSGAGSDPRAGSLERLARGELDVIFAVDMFNEGIDVPNIDTVFMLRPTESAILWLQQFGRGLRKADGKDHLTVIDYIGNHRVFLNRPRILLDLDQGDVGVERTLNLIERREFHLPPGCEVTYELEAIEILRGMIAPAVGPIEAFYRDFHERNGVRPTAAEVFHAGCGLRSLWPRYGQWFGFVREREKDGLTVEERAVLDEAGDFLKVLETTPMTRSYKMVLLLAMIKAGKFPGEIRLNELTEEVRRIVEGSNRLRVDFNTVTDDPVEWQDLLVANPIAAWTGGRGTGGVAYFTYQNQTFSSCRKFGDLNPDTLREMVREIAEWRLADYLQRDKRGGLVCRVSHSSRRPIIRLPDRNRLAGIPFGITKVIADGEEYEAEFVRIAVNVVRRPGEALNVLPDILRKWFGPRAGLPGTRHKVEFTKLKDRYRLAPLRPID